MKKIGVLGLMAALAVTGAVAFLPKGVMAADQPGRIYRRRGCLRDDAGRSEKSSGR